MPYAEAKAGKATSKKTLHHFEVIPGVNGGHTVRHHFASPMHGGEFHDPEEYPFGPEQGHEVLAHIAKHLGIEMHAGGKAEESPHEEAAENE